MVELKCRLMPYLYQQAVYASETGIPMLRPMFMEYPKDRTCLTLDLQYMMGESLLVAPVFKENGEADYYVPEGKWYNLLTDEVKEGGRWYTDTFDYHTMPLLVAPGKVLALGSCCTKPDYEFAEGVTLALSYLADGERTEAVIPNLKGEPVMHVKAERSGQKITVNVQGGNGNWSGKVLWDKDAVIEKDDSHMVITLGEGK